MVSLDICTASPYVCRHFRAHDCFSLSAPIVWNSEKLRIFIPPDSADYFPSYGCLTSSLGRLARLIPQSNAAIYDFFNHRLSPLPEPASSEFLTFLTGTAPLYDPLPTPQALLIRSILSHLHLEILKRGRPPSWTFNYQSASIGNLFLTGARLFSGSFEAAIYLMAMVGQVDESRTEVLPSIVSNFTHHISAGLADGTTITGQNAISHPSAPTAIYPSTADPLNPDFPFPTGDPGEDAHLPGSLPHLRMPYISFSKLADEPLPARIARIWYINPYGQEMTPAPNLKVISAIREADAIIYSIGSLYTSLAPSLILRGVGDAIAGSSAPNGTRPRFKILILNGSLDRETGGFSAQDFVAAIARACEQSRGVVGDAEPFLWSRYVTHLIYLEGEGAPAVDRDELSMRGVERVRLYGRKSSSVDPLGQGMRYDDKALAQALGAILGKRDPRELRPRRNTAGVHG